MLQRWIALPTALTISRQFAELTATFVETEILFYFGTRSKHGSSGCFSTAPIPERYVHIGELTLPLAEASK